ncbi:MAG: hypothetical protein DCC65_06330 [Planctomycetota bacterium]|nr:MAG: hypothetical protein DCC65_06330 [Planctomycetota bacterium]
MIFTNKLELRTDRLLAMIEPHIAGWPHDELDVTVRPSRGAEFSGTCRYVPPRIYVNIGAGNRYPYLITTHIAPARSDRRCWWRELYTVELADAYELTLFIFLHEFYHWLIRKARRNGRQKEGRCDRFATRALVDVYGAVVRDSAGRPVPRAAWDFQDLDGFVAAARQAARQRISPRPVEKAARQPSAQPPKPLPDAVQPPLDGQLLLFSI